jgi:NADPH:quinone reductase-like Zn-dependent oxidoreductase
MGLKMPLPFLKDGPRSGYSPSSVLILGGSSAVGASAIQLLRLALPSCRILATSSPKHHRHLTETLGADVAIDRSSASLAEEVKAETEGASGVEAILDVVGAGAKQRDIFNALDPAGPRRYAQVWTGDDEIKAPDGVESVLFRSRQLPELPGGMNALQALRRLMEEGKYRLPVPVHNVGAGLEGLTKGLDLIRQGVSGEKLVVTMS